LPPPPDPFVRVFPGLPAEIPSTSFFSRRPSDPYWLAKSSRLGGGSRAPQPVFLLDEPAYPSEESSRRDSAQIFFFLGFKCQFFGPFLLGKPFVEHFGGRGKPNVFFCDAPGGTFMAVVEVLHHLSPVFGGGVPPPPWPQKPCPFFQFFLHPKKQQNSPGGDANSFFFIPVEELDDPCVFEAFFFFMTYRFFSGPPCPQVEKGGPFGESIKG